MGILKNFITDASTWVSSLNYIQLIIAVLVGIVGIKLIKKAFKLAMFLIFVAVFLLSKSLIDFSYIGQLIEKLAALR